MAEWDVVNATPAQAPAAPKQDAWGVVGHEPLTPANSLALRVEKAESNHNPNAMNKRTGAEGAMQTLPSTERDPGYGVTPAQNDSNEEKARVGRDYLEALRKKYGNDTLALAAYNWGPGHVDNLVAKTGGPDKVGVENFTKHLPMETQNYIKNINWQPVSSTPANAAIPAAKPAENKPGTDWRDPLKGNPIAEKLASLEEPAIQGGANLVSQVAAPMLSDEQKKKLQAEGKYDPNALPAAGYGQAITGPVGAAVIQPVMNAVSSAADTTGKKIGLSDTARSNIGKVAGAGMNALAVAGLPEAAKVGAAERGIAGTQLPVSQRTPLSVETKMAKLEKAHDVSSNPKKQEAFKQQMENLQKQHPEMANADWTPVKTDIPVVTAASSASSIFSPDTGIASTKGLATVRGVADRLFAEKNRGAVDQAELLQWLQKQPEIQKGGLKSTWEKFQAHEDDPTGVPLTPEEQGLYDRSLKVIDSERSIAQKTIRDNGHKPEDFDEDPEAVHENVGGATRQVVGKNTPMDRLLGIKPGSAVSSRSASRTAGSSFSRNMKAAIINGERKIVHVQDDGTLVDAKDPTKKLGTTNDTPLKEATQKEITDATEGRIQYHQNSLGVKTTALLQERRAARNIKLLKELPKASGAEDVIRPPGTKIKNVPNGWREIPDMPAFRGYHFEPKFAEEIEDHFNAVRQKDGLAKALESTNNFMKSAFFWLNPAHAYNVAEAFAVSKGALGFVKDFPATVQDFLKSVKSVVQRDKVYMQGARAGVPYRGLDSMQSKFNAGLLNAMGERARQDPQTFTQFAKEFGFNKPADLIKRVAQISHDVPFGLQDILQQTLERGLERKGKSQAQATEEIARTLPNYRTKARYFNQRMLGQAAKGSAFLQFPGWDIGRLSGMANILKGAAGLSPKELDQLLMIAVLYEFGTQVVDPVVRQATGNENAEGPTAGYGSLVKAGKDVYTGEKSPGQAILSLFPKGYIPRAVEGIAGVNSYTGQKTSLPGESPLEVGYDYAKNAAEELDPLKRLANVMSGKSGLKEEAWRQIGVKSPSDQETMSKLKAKHYTEKELLHKRAKEPDWIKP